MENLYDKAKRLTQGFLQELLEEGYVSEELEEWVRSSEEGRKVVEELSAPGSRASLLKRFGQNEKQRALAEFRYRIRGKKMRRLALSCAKVAAVLVLAAGVALFAYMQRTERAEVQVAEGRLLPGKQQATLILGDGRRVDLTQAGKIKEGEHAVIDNSKDGMLTYNPEETDGAGDLYHTVIVPRHGEYSLVLADGSRIKLNAESELRYPIAFGGEQREVYLKGEAYMEIAPSEKPFLVHVYDAEVKVYGTVFNINSYDPKQIDVVLVKGKVGVRDGVSEEVVLHPNQLASIVAGEGIEVKKDINASYYIAWQEGFFAFEAERLEDIMTILARWYQMEVVFTNPRLKDVRFTASLKREEEVASLLNQFELTQDVSFQVIGNRIIIQ